MEKLKIPAKIENLNEVISCLDNFLESCDCSLKTQMQLDIAVEEIFVNIAHYAYGEDVGTAEIYFELSSDKKKISVKFVDNGMPYDPSKKEDPDITLSAEERNIGGLGIYMVKKSMDKMEYEYKDGKNILLIEKFL